MHLAWCQQVIQHHQRFTKSSSNKKMQESRQLARINKQLENIFLKSIKVRKIQSLTTGNTSQKGTIKAREEES